VAITLCFGACGGYSQEELDAAVQEAVDEALAEEREAQTEATSTTTAPPLTTTTSTAVTTTSMAAPQSTTSVVLDGSDPRASGVVAGNAAPPLPVGEPGVTVIAGHSSSDPTFDVSRLTLVVRNNSDQEVRGIDVAFTIRDSDGGLLVSGSTSDFSPYRVEPGGIALGSGFISELALPENVQFEFDVSTSDFEGGGRENVTIAEHALQAGAIVAIVGNDNTFPMHLVSVNAVCFREDGTTTWSGSGFADRDSIESGGTSSVTVDRPSDIECPTYLLAGAGFEE
jgi:hypothetical protein